MSLVPWSRDFGDIDRYFNSFFENFPLGFSFSRPNTPRVDVYQTDKEVVVKAEVPGVSKEDLNLFIDENHVRISGQTRKSEDYTENNVYRSERYYGNFSRLIPLPADVKQNEAKAEYKDGILTVTVPKAEGNRGRGHQIQIQ